MRTIHVAVSMVFVFCLCASLLYAPFLHRNGPPSDSDGPMVQWAEDMVVKTGAPGWAPSFGPAPVDGQEAWYYEHDVIANETVTWNISHNLPLDLTVESNDTAFHIEGVPQVGDKGEYWINATALSVEGLLETTHNWTFNLTLAWAAIISPPAHDAYVDTYYEHHAFVNESIMGVIAYYNLPGSLKTTIDHPNAKFTIFGTPQEGDEGNYSVNYTVWSLDGKLESNVVWNFTVHPAPLIEENPPNLLATAAVILIVLSAALLMRRWP